MNIYHSLSFSHLSNFLFTENFLPTLSIQNKRIATIALVIFSAFSALYILYQCFKSQVKELSRSQDDDDLDIKPEVDLTDPQTDKVAKAFIPSFESTDEVGKTRTVAKLAASISDKKFFEALFEKNKGIYFSDNHADISNIQYLISNIPLFAELGVKHLYVEQDREELAQFDLFNDSKEGDDNYNAFLENYKKSNEHYIQFYPGYTRMQIALFIQAKRHGIKLKPMDVSKKPSDDMVYTMDGDILGKDNKIKRAKESNAGWVKAIQQDNKALKKSDRFIVFGGGGHAKEFEGIQGVSESLGIPTIEFMNQHLLPPLKQAQAYLPLTPKYYQFSKDADFTLMAQPSAFSVDAVAKLEEFLLPVKEHRFEQLFQVYESKWKGQFKHYQIPIKVEYEIGKRTIEIEEDGENLLQFIDHEPIHRIIINGLDSIEAIALEVNVKKQWQKEISSDEMTVNLSDDKHGIEFAFKNNSAFERFLKG